jgi:hypothetical protein
MGEVGERLPSKHKAQSSNSSITKKTQKLPQGQTKILKKFTSLKIDNFSLLIQLIATWGVFQHC